MHQHQHRPQRPPHRRGDYSRQGCDPQLFQWSSGDIFDLGTHTNKCPQLLTRYVLIKPEDFLCVCIAVLSPSCIFFSLFCIFFCFFPFLNFQDMSKFFSYFFISFILFFFRTYNKQKGFLFTTLFIHKEKNIEMLIFTATGHLRGHQAGIYHNFIFFTIRLGCFCVRRFTITGKH